MADALGSLTEVLFDTAIKQANELDEYFQKYGKLVGPLHGICMTLKDQFDVEGFDSTLGYVGRAFKPAPQDCTLVALLKQMGAIIVAKSNLPQSIMVRHRHEATRPGAARGPNASVVTFPSRSGARLTIHYGDSPCIRRVPNLPLEAPRAVKVRSCHFEAP